MAGTERCVGCDQAARLETGGHPVAAVMNREDAAARGFTELPENARGFVQVPVCQACFVDPAHRVFPIKGHFFPKASAATGLQHAGSNRVGK